MEQRIKERLETYGKATLLAMHSRIQEERERRKDYDEHVAAFGMNNLDAIGLSRNGFEIGHIIELYLKAKYLAERGFAPERELVLSESELKEILQHEAGRENEPAAYSGKADLYRGLLELFQSK